MGVALGNLTKVSATVDISTFTSQASAAFDGTGADAYLTVTEFGFAYLGVDANESGTLMQVMFS